MAIAKLSDFISKLPAETFVTINRNMKTLSISSPKVFKDMRFGCVYDEKKSKLTIYPVTNDYDGVKCSHFMTQGSEQYRLVFGLKWIKGMPLVSTGKRVLAKWDSKEEGYIVDLSDYVKTAPQEVKQIEKEVKIEEVNKMSIPQAAKCVQYLNAFIESDKGFGFHFDILDGKLRMKKEEIIE